MSKYLCAATALLAIFCSGVSQADSQLDCKIFSDKADKDGSTILGMDAEQIVIGKGRLQFYSAPRYSCKMLGVFIFKNEAVVAYTTYGSFTSVAYLNGKGGGPVMGWVESNRLKPNGLGIAPRQ